MCENQLLQNQIDNWMYNIVAFILLSIYKDWLFAWIINKTKILIHKKNLFKQYIVLIIVFQKMLKFLIILKFQRF